MKRTLFFKDEVLLTIDFFDRLIIEFSNPTKEKRSIPIEDIGMIIIEHPRSFISNSVFSQLLKYNTTIVSCDEKHTPIGMFLNFQGHSNLTQKYRNQIKNIDELKSDLWCQTISKKIRNQATLLKSLDFNVKNMIYWSNHVHNNDTKNYESRAAVFYWKNLYAAYIQNFKRDRFAAPPNNLLNYGYAILRSICIKNLIGSGLLPMIGIHHSNKHNPYCLADDIMEPYRPFVDKIVLDIITQTPNNLSLTDQTKLKLVSIENIVVKVNGRNRTLQDAMNITTSSLSQIMDKKLKKIKYPEF
jgi:CRISPR-associated protein Cas1